MPTTDTHPDEYLIKMVKSLGHICCSIRGWHGNKHCPFCVSDACDLKRLNVTVPLCSNALH